MDLGARFQLRGGSASSFGRCDEASTVHDADCGTVGDGRGPVEQLWFAEQVT